MCEVEELLILLVVFAVDLTLAVHYYVELVRFLFKEPNLYEIIQYETLKERELA